jgi:hypothetical protein
MTKLFSLILLLLHLNCSFGQKETAFPPGITIDPAIEQICKSKKDINSFKIVHLVNDSIRSNPGLTFLSKFPLTSFVSVNKEDSLIGFIGMITPYGFQIRLRSKDSDVLTFVSSKSCKCFKDSLSASWGYGAGVKPTSLTLVQSKIDNIKVGEKIYGYVKTGGGDIFHYTGGNEKYEKWSFEYEGFFVIEFRPLG